jgi:hypothetical protein
MLDVAVWMGVAMSIAGLCVEAVHAAARRHIR